MKPADTPIDPKEIIITFTEIDPPDYKVEFEIPQRLVKRIYKKLKKGGLNYNEHEMVALLVRICIDEGTCRLDRETIWGFMPMPGAPRPVSSINAPFTFTSVTDTFSLDDIPSFDSIQIKKLHLEVTNDLIEQEIEAQKLECGTRIPHKGTLAIGDEITANISLAVDGETPTLFELKNVQLQLQGSENVAVIGQFPFEGLHEQLLGLELSEKIVLQTQVPLSYGEKSLRGKSATLTFQVSSVESIKPASLKEVLKQYGTPNETVLRAQIKSSLQHNFDREKDLVMLNQLYESLIDIFDIDIPQRIIQAHFSKQCESTLKHSEDKKELTEEEKTDILSKSTKFLHRQSITTRLCRHLDIKVNENEIDNQIRNMAARRRERPEDVKADFINNMGAVRNMCAENKILLALKKRITFIDA